MKSLALASLVTVLCVAPAVAQNVQPDASLLAEIRAIRAIDNHAHILPSSPGDTSPVTDPRGLPAFTYPVRLRIDNAEWAGIWRTLYGTTGRVADVVHAQQALVRKRALIAAHGSAWPATVLDRLNIETVLVNLTPLGRGLEAPSARWVPHGNALVLPFGASGAPAVGRRTAASLEAQRRAITDSLTRWRAAGAVAVKLSIAYQRPLAFAPVPQAEAERAWRMVLDTTSRSTDRVTAARAVEDYLVHALARDAGAVGLVLHVHTGVGANAWFDLAGADPLLLEPFVRDSALRRTRFVLLHGGWPHDRQAGAMLIHPNVWADFSAHTFLRSERDLAGTLRSWLEWYPEKVLFGTDAYPDAAIRGWEESMAMANGSARRALAIALTGMMQDGQITRARAGELARMVLRDNARALYGL